MDYQNKLREDIIALHNEKGIMYNFFSKQIGVSRCHFSKWIHGERNLGKQAYADLVRLYGILSDN